MRKYDVMVNGSVTYMNGENQRVSIPAGRCMVTDHDGAGPFQLDWFEGLARRCATFTKTEWGYYTGSGAVKVAKLPPY